MALIAKEHGGPQNKGEQFIFTVIPIVYNTMTKSEGVMTRVGISMYTIICICLTK